MLGKQEHGCLTVKQREGTLRADDVFPMSIGDDASRRPAARPHRPAKHGEGQN